MSDDDEAAFEGGVIVDHELRRAEAEAEAEQRRRAEAGEPEPESRWVVSAAASKSWEQFFDRMAEMGRVELANQAKVRAQLTFPADCATGPRRGYVVKQLIAPGDVAALIGAPGSGKSVLAPHVGYAIAQGRPVFGLRTWQGRALYIAAEDVSGMRQRIHALKLRHGDAPDFALAECGNLLIDPTAADDLRSLVWGFDPALVVLDTVGAAWAGMDENSSQDMGKVVALARELARGGCAVLLVHHVAKHGDGTPRGHSVLNGTLDFSLRLEPPDDGGVIRGRISKNRNGTTERDIAFRIDVADLGIDDDGDTITAPIAHELTGGMLSSRPKLSRSAAGALRTLAALVAETPDNSVAEAAWRARCDAERSVSASDNPDSRRRSFVRAYADLIDAGRIAFNQGVVSIVGRIADFTAEPAGQPGQLPDS